MAVEEIWLDSDIGMITCACGEEFTISAERKDEENVCACGRKYKFHRAWIELVTDGS